MELKVGYGRVDITPDRSVPLAGLGNTLKRMSETVLDRLLCTCLAFTDEEGSTALLFTSDLIRAMPGIEGAARKLILEKFGVPEGNIMFANTHTHSATDYLQAEHPNVQRAAEMLTQKFVEVAGAALADRMPAALYSGCAYPQSLNFVRHYVRDPETKALVGHPYAPDNQLQLVKIAREGAKDIMIMNWQAHPCFTSGYDKHDVSADYIHSFREMFEAENDVLFAFFLGASGDVNARSRIKEEVIAPTRDIYVEKMRSYIQEAMNTMRPIPAGAVKVGKKDLTLINDHSDDHRVEDAKIVAQFWKESYDRKATDAMAKQYGINSPYHANAIIGRAARGETTEVSIYAASIGGLGFVFAPYEMFCNNGIFIKKNAPKDVTIVATCANAGCGYLADDFAFEDQCYEVDTRKFERGTAEKVASAFEELLTQL